MLGGDKMDIDNMPAGREMDFELIRKVILLIENECPSDYNLIDSDCDKTCLNCWFKAVTP